MLFSLCVFLFRSHQKLLIDTATSEFLFLLEFFANPSNPQHHASTTTTTSSATTTSAATSADASSSSTPPVKQLTVMVDSFGSRQPSPVELVVESDGVNGSLGHGSLGHGTLGPQQWQQSRRHNLVTNKMKILFTDVFQK